MHSGRISLVLSLSVGLLMISTGIAQATTPNCSAGRNKRGYDTGKIIGANIVQQAGSGAVCDDPDSFDDFAETVLDAVDTVVGNMATDASEYVQCRVKGLVQGVSDELDAVQECVVGMCLLDGVMWGQISAHLYCLLSSSLPGIAASTLLPAPPTTLCGETFEDSCHAEFDTFTSTPSNACQSFTGASNVVYTSSKATMCAYSL